MHVTLSQMVDPVSPKGLRVKYNSSGTEATATNLSGKEDPSTIYMQVCVSVFVCVTPNVHLRVCVCARVL
jgi:hypothetical protein